MPDTYQATLRDAVLRGTPAGNTSRVAISGLAQTEHVYLLPASATEADKFAFFAHLVVRGTSTEEKKEAWRAFLLTVVCLAFPSVGAKTIADRPGLYVTHELSDNDVASLREYLEVCDEWTQIPATDTDLKAEAKQTAVEQFLDLEYLPGVTSTNMRETIGKCLTIEAMYGYTSLVLFLAGKTITDQNRGAVTTKRPSAIERKYDLGTVPCLSGEMRMSNIAHRLIHVGFVSMNHARKNIFMEVAKFSNETGDKGVEVAAVTTRLMAYSGMQHVVLIDKFLSGEPDAEVIPVLASSLVYYTSSLKELENTPVELRPYYKLIHGDTVQAFNRKHVEPLMVVAIKSEQETNPTLQNYNLPENNNEIITAYNRYKAHATRV